MALGGDATSFYQGGVGPLSILELARSLDRKSLASSLSLPSPRSQGLLLGHKHQTGPHFPVLGLPWAGGLPLPEGVGCGWGSRYSAPCRLFCGHLECWSCLYKTHTHPGRDRGREEALRLFPPAASVPRLSFPLFCPQTL